MKKHVLYVLGFMYSISSPAGTIYDTYNTPKTESGPRIDRRIEVKAEGDREVRIRLVSSAGIEKEVVYDLNRLRVIAVEESIEKLKIFNAAPKGQGGSGLGETFVLATFLLPFMALFIPMGPAAVIPYIILGIVTLISNITGTAPEPADPKVLIASGASLALKALEEPIVAASRADQSDVLVKVMGNLDILMKRHLRNEKRVYVPDVSPDEMRTLFSSWADSLERERIELATRKLDQFDRMNLEAIATYQLALVRSALTMLETSPSDEDLRFLKILTSKKIQ